MLSRDAESSEGSALGSEDSARGVNEIGSLHRDRHLIPDDIAFEHVVVALPGDFRFGAGDCMRTSRFDPSKSSRIMPDVLRTHSGGQHASARSWSRRERRARSCCERPARHSVTFVRPSSRRERRSSPTRPIGRRPEFSPDTVTRVRSALGRMEILRTPAGGAPTSRTSVT